MKRYFFLLLMAVTFAGSIHAQNSVIDINQKYSLRAQVFTAMYLDNSTHFNKLGLDELEGVNVGLELPSSQQRPWQQYLGNPKVGVGLSLIDFANSYLGYAVAAYPYIRISALADRIAEVDFKVAGGLAAVTETFYTQEANSPNQYWDSHAMTNNVFGSYLNAYLSLGANMSVNLTPDLALSYEMGYFHMSNGRTSMPNLGINVVYGSLGVLATFNGDVKKEPVKFPSLPYGWSINITGAGGKVAAWMAEDKHPVVTFHTGAVYSVTNWYGLGLGADVFYNSSIGAETNRAPLLYRADHDYTTLDKVRVGVALNNEFRFGVVTAMADWGVYLFNPSRNYYNTNHPIYGHGKRPLFYDNAEPGKDEAFHYIRFGMKARVWDNLYVQASAKTHLHICEYLEFGLGYQIPFLKKSNRQDRDDIIFHYTPQWWKRF